MILKNKKIKQKIIRLRKKGIKFYPLYDIIVTFKNNRSKGFILEKLGFINPNSKSKEIYINSYRLSYWLNKGVYLNNTIKKYLVKFIF